MDTAPGDTLNATARSAVRYAASIVHGAALNAPALAGQFLDGTPALGVTARVKRTKLARVSFCSTNGVTGTEHVA
jgi:hypothetical protein